MSRVISQVNYREFHSIAQADYRRYSEQCHETFYNSSSESSLSDVSSLLAEISIYNELKTNLRQ
jgi:hypothetical protein